jgi:hypothetical protein
MAEFKVTSPDGKTFKVTAPDDATPEQVEAYAQQMMQPSQAYRAGERRPELGRGVVNATQGPLFGFADELAGAGAAAVDKITGRNPGVPFKDLYQGYRDSVRGASESYGKERPVASAVAQVAASLPAASVALPMKVAVTAGQRLAAAAKLGAAYGGISAVGEADDMSDATGQKMMLGMGVGGALGPAANVVGAGAGATYRGVASRFNRGSAQDYAMSRVANSFLRDSQPGANTLDEARARLRELGPEARIADLGGGEGQNARGLLDTITTLPGATKNETEAAIRARQVSRPARLDEATNAATGANGRRLYGTVEGLIEQRSKDSGPLYDQVRSMSIPADPAIAEMVSAAKKLGLTREASRTALREGMPFTLAQDATEYSMRDLDYIKRAVDGQIGTAKASGNADTVRSLMRYKERLLGHLDGATGGAYAQARSAYAGPSALMDAAEQGRAFLNNNVVPDKLRADLNMLGASERDAFMVGVNEALRLKAGAQAGQTELMGLWKNRNLQERLRAVFPDQQAYDAFARRMAGEDRLNRLTGVGRGSPTASRQAALDDETANLLSTMGDVAAAKAGSPSAMVSLVRNMYGRAAMPEPVRDRIGGLLLSQGDDASKVLGDMSTYLETQGRKRAAQASRAGMTGALTGNGLLGLLQ